MSLPCSFSHFSGFLNKARTPCSTTRFLLGSSSVEYPEHYVDCENNSNDESKNEFFVVL